MDKILLDMLICPKSNGKLIHNESTNELFCYESMLAYPIENDIPIMLIDRGRKLKEGEKKT